MTILLRQLNVWSTPSGSGTRCTRDLQREQRVVADEGEHLHEHLVTERVLRAGVLVVVEVAADRRRPRHVERLLLDGVGERERCPGADGVDLVVGQPDLLPDAHVRPPLELALPRRRDDEDHELAARAGSRPRKRSIPPSSCSGIPEIGVVEHRVERALEPALLVGDAARKRRALAAPGDRVVERLLVGFENVEGQLLEPHGALLAVRAEEVTILLAPANSCRKLGVISPRHPGGLGLHALPSEGAHFADVLRLERDDAIHQSVGGREPVGLGEHLDAVTAIRGIGRTAANGRTRRRRGRARSNSSA